MLKSESIILGIDPGTRFMGYALLQVRDKEMKVLEMDIWNFTSEENHYVRLKMIFEEIKKIIMSYQPDALAIEAPFYGKNIQSMLKLGRSQGVVIATALSTGLSITEYAPKKIKQSITGNGNASKEQVWKMLQQILHINEKPLHFDATDALSVALCHVYQQSSLCLKEHHKSYKNWKDYLNQHTN